jgi:hypothetical protein
MLILIENWLMSILIDRFVAIQQFTTDLCRFKLKNKILEFGLKHRRCLSPFTFTLSRLNHYHHISLELRY